MQAATVSASIEYSGLPPAGEDLLGLGRSVAVDEDAAAGVAAEALVAGKPGVRDDDVSPGAPDPQVVV